MRATHITVPSVSGKSLQHSVRIDHGTHSLHLQLPWLNRVSLPGDQGDVAIDLFSEINDYWAHLSYADQTKIYLTYDKLAGVMGEKGSDEDDLFASVIDESQLVPLIEELYSYHNVNTVMQWIQLRSDINLPVDPNRLPTQYPSGGVSNTTPEKTYLQEEYHYLVGLTLVLRSLLPVWGPYIQNTQRTISSDLKEYNALKLIMNTGYYSHHSMCRLFSYVESKIPSDFNANGVVMFGIASDDYSEYLMANVILRKLCVARINNPGTDAHIARMIHGFIQNFVNTNNGRSNGVGIDVRTKELHRGGDGDDTKTSVSENYRLHTDLAAGEIVAIQIAFLDPMSMPHIPDELRQSTTPEAEAELARLSELYKNPGLPSPTKFQHTCLTLCPDMPADIIRISYKCATSMGDDPLFESRLMVARMIMRRIMYPRAFDYLPRIAGHLVLGIAQAVLWHRGFKELAVLMTAAVYDEGEVIKRSMVTAEQKRELVSLTSFVPDVESKAAAVAIINTAAEEIESYKWRLRVPSSWYESIGFNINTCAAQNLRIQLADIAIATIRGNL